MALESTGTILYVAKISYQSHNWYGNCEGGPKLYTDTHTDTQTHIHGGPFYKSCFSAKMQKQD